MFLNINRAAFIVPAEAGTTGGPTGNLADNPLILSLSKDSQQSYSRLGYACPKQWFDKLTMNGIRGGVVPKMTIVDARRSGF